MVQSSSDTVFIPLEQVESEHCALIIGKALSQIDGIQNPRVELNNQRASVQVKDKNVLYNAVSTIRDLGYGVTLEKKSFPVLNMSCASCAVSAESTVKALAGVLNASVNYANGMLHVEYFPNMVSPAGFQQALQEVGYDLLIEQESNQQDALELIRQKKYKMLKRRAVLANLFALPVMIIGMFMMDMPYANEIMCLFSTPVVFWLGQSFFVNAWKQAKHRSANMDTLVALSTGIAYVYSVFSMLFPEFWHSRGMHPHVYFEASAVVIAFILLGKLLEEKAKGNTSAAIQKLMSLQASSVTLVRNDGSAYQAPLEAVRTGDTIWVKPGEKIAVDGQVTEGDSYVDESMLSGEPVPVLKAAGAKVFAGTLNQKGSFRMHAEKLGRDTLLGQIIRAVQDAQGSKAPIQKQVDRIAAVFVPAVLLLALITLLAWIWFGAEHNFAFGLKAALSVLVIACPCALGLATPTAVMVGVGKGAEQGILIKDAESLELAGKVKAVLLDKTGTITEGRPRVNNIHWLPGAEKYRGLLYSMEKHAEHPLAGAVIAYLNETETLNLDSFESITGKGIQAVYQGRRYWVGNRRLLTGNNIQISDELDKKAETWSEDAQTLIWFADQKKALAVLALSDQMKESSALAVQRLEKMGMEVYMLTGDQEASARSIAAKAGIRRYQSGMLPADKAEFVKKLQEKGMVVAMVGDGINDSTALATADVSIAMGRGSDIAMETAKMTIMSSDLNKIPDAVQLSRQTVRTIRQNLFWAFIYNLIGIPIAAGVLYPLNGFLINPMIAGAAMALSSVSVVSNSLRLRWSSLSSTN